MAKTNLSYSENLIRLAEFPEKNNLRVAFKAPDQPHVTDHGFEFFPVCNPLQKLIRRNSLFLLHLVK